MRPSPRWSIAVVVALLLSVGAEAAPRKPKAADPFAGCLSSREHEVGVAHWCGEVIALALDRPEAAEGAAPGVDREADGWMREMVLHSWPDFQGRWSLARDAAATCDGCTVLRGTWTPKATGGGVPLPEIAYWVKGTRVVGCAAPAEDRARCETLAPLLLQGRVDAGRDIGPRPLAALTPIWGKKLRAPTYCYKARIGGDASYADCPESQITYVKQALDVGVSDPTESLKKDVGRRVPAQVYAAPPKTLPVCKVMGVKGECIVHTLYWADERATRVYTGVAGKDGEGLLILCVARGLKVPKACHEVLGI